MLNRFSAALLAIMVVVVGMGMSGNGCPSAGNLPLTAGANTPLAGTWSLTRGSVRVTIIWTVNGGGDVTKDSVSTKLEPLDASAFPTSLQPLAQQWNSGLADLNEHLDEVFPATILIDFPHWGAMVLTSAVDPSKSVEGAIDSTGEYIFLTDLTGANEGANQGGGTVLQATILRGTFDRNALTTAGKLARTLLAQASGAGGGSLGFTAQISIDYTGTRTGDLPSSSQTAGGG